MQTYRCEKKETNKQTNKKKKHRAQEQEHRPIHDQ